MQVAASFIEYLVVGCLTLLWILPLVHDKENLFSKDSGYMALILFPVTYVLGMFVDYLSKGLIEAISAIRENVKDKWESLPQSAGKKEEHTPPEKEGPEVVERSNKDFSSTAFIALHSAELNKELQTRSSRDRIARGAFLNAIVVFVLTSMNVSLFPTDIHEWFGRFYFSLFLLVVAIVTYFMWSRFDRLSTRCKRNAVKVIQDKLKMENKT